MDKDTQPLVGGRYLVKDGVRTLVEEPTKDHPDGNRAREADGTPIAGPGERQANASAVAAEAAAAETAEPGSARRRTKGAD